MDGGGGTAGRTRATVGTGTGTGGWATRARARLAIGGLVAGVAIVAAGVGAGGGLVGSPRGPGGTPAGAVSAGAAGSPGSAALDLAEGSATGAGQPRIRRLDEDGNQVTRYWTPGRRAHAAIADVVGRPAATDRAGPAVRVSTVPAGSGVRAVLTLPGAVPLTLDAALPGSTAPSAVRTPLATSQVTPYVDGGEAARANGALFTTIGGVDYACSGSVVQSAGRDLVVTAGHCLHGGGAGETFATNVVFIPGYAGGAAPYGVWTASQLEVTAGWAGQQTFDEDAGFAAFQPKGGRRLEDVVGGFRIAFGLPHLLPQRVFGYPRLPPFNGGTLMYCDGSPSADPGSGQSLGLRCPMTAGASGGPWLAGFSGGTGWVDAVVSYTYLKNPNIIYGTAFGPTIQALFQSANTL